MAISPPGWGRSRKRPLRKDWVAVKDSIMHEAVLARFTRYADLREVLLGTGDAKIVEHTENDRYWGGVGENRLGRILMRGRQELRSAGAERDRSPDPNDPSGIHPRCSDRRRPPTWT